MKSADGSGAAHVHSRHARRRAAGLARLCTRADDSLSFSPPAGNLTPSILTVAVYLFVTPDTRATSPQTVRPICLTLTQDPNQYNVYSIARSCCQEGEKIRARHFLNP